MKRATATRQYSPTLCEMRNSKLLRLIAAVVAALFFLAACGGGGSDDSADSDTSSTGDSNGGASDDAGSGDSDSTGSDDSDSDASSDDMSGSAASSWCDGAREISELADAIDAENLGMIATFERQMRELLPMQIALASQAPDEIAADVELFVDGLVQMQQTLEEADYNILDVNEEDMAVLDSPELNAASDRIEDTLNYKAVAKRVIGFVQDSQFELVETLAERVAQLILDEFEVPWLRLTLNKQGAVRGARDVGLIIERRRG